jgi:phosphoribosylanthranilate isomerase
MKDYWINNLRIISEYVRHWLKCQWDFTVSAVFSRWPDRACAFLIQHGFFMIIQVYEVQTQKEAEQLISMGVDHIGSVILSSDNWKHPVLKDVIRTVGELGARSSLIPLFDDIHVIKMVLEYYQPDIIHFCEMLPDQIHQPAVLEKLLHQQWHIKEAFPQTRVMRSLPIPQPPHSNAVLDYARLFEPVSDFFLTDTLMAPKDIPVLNQDAEIQPVSGFIGITGKTCNWNVARDLVAASNIPVILAGGITPENVAAGIQKVRPAGVDSCTGTNACDHHGKTIRFQKDMNKVKRLVAAARQAATH